MEPNHDALTYLQKPYLVKNMNLKFNREIISYSNVLPQSKKAVEAHFLIFIHTGGHNKDQVFTICCKDTEGQTRKWIMGHGYAQNAWSYNSTTISLPVNHSRTIEVLLDNQQPGNAALQILLVAYR